MMKERYNIRHLARFIIEAKTPLAVGSGEKDFITDNHVLKDINNLPYIPATSIAGVLRHTLEKTSQEDILWGFQNETDGMGSRIIFSDAVMLDQDGSVVENLITEKNPFLSRYNVLPIRQHASITHLGTTKDKGKFDEEITFKGTRFCFEIEFIDRSDNENKNGIHENEFHKLINTISSGNLRIGGGTRTGFGEICVVSYKTKTLNLIENLSEYIEKTSALSDTTFWDKVEDCIPEVNKNDDLRIDTLEIKPDDFFLFGSGFGDEDADMTPVSESMVTWENGKAKFIDNCILIPGASVKGALAHRVAYHYNKITGVFAEEIKNTEPAVGTLNPAVRILFGSENQGKEGRATVGNIMISDVIEKKSSRNDKLLNHVAIDRFTGGALDGALFSEKVNNERGRTFSIKIVLNKRKADKAIKEEQKKEKSIESDKIYEALEMALDDICNGRLPLGGGVNRGNGIFNGSRNKGIFKK